MTCGAASTAPRQRVRDLVAEVDHEEGCVESEGHAGMSAGSGAVAGELCVVRLVHLGADEHSEAGDQVRVGGERGGAAGLDPARPRRGRARFLRGWAGYFRYGNAARQFTRITGYAAMRVLLWWAKRERLRRRPRRRQFVLAGQLGLLQLDGWVVAPRPNRPWRVRWIAGR